MTLTTLKQNTEYDQQEAQREVQLSGSKDVLFVHLAPKHIRLL